MNIQQTPKRISCRRCQSKKIRCNKADPRCDKCEAAGEECIYLPRKHRTRKRSYASGVNDRDILFDILRRLERVEDHCNLNQNGEETRLASRPVSVPSVDSPITGPISTSPDTFPGAKSHSPAAHQVAHGILDMIKDPAARSQLFSNAFCHLRNAESRFFENENCTKAMGTVTTEIEYLGNAQMSEIAPSHPVIPKEMAKKCLQKYYDTYHFEGFHIPLEKSFLMSIPDLLEIPHVQLDYTSQIIYYNILLHGIMLDSDDDLTQGDIMPYIYRTCMGLADGWLSQVKNTPADLLAAFVMTAMALECCNVELSWRMLGHSCMIATALGYFTVDGDPGYANGQNTPIEKPTENETEIDRNRKRFEFWHLLRTDCLFRLSFGKPALIRGGSWRVNFPDPTINGVDDASTRVIQIHFLASMRLTLVLLKYLDLVGVIPPPDPAAYDSTIDSLIQEVQSITSGWNAVCYLQYYRKSLCLNPWRSDIAKEELLNTTTNHIDSSFYADILCNSYKMLIVFDQAKKCNQNSHPLPCHTVNTARKSLQTFRFLMGSAFLKHWGISLILLHQTIPLLILCLDIIESHERGGIEEDLAMVAWVSDFVESTAVKRVELRPAKTLMKALTLVCQQAKSGGQ